MELNDSGGDGSACDECGGFGGGCDGASGCDGIGSIGGGCRCDGVSGCNDIDVVFGDSFDGVNFDDGDCNGSDCGDISRCDDGGENGKLCEDIVSDCDSSCPECELEVGWLDEFWVCSWEVERCTLDGGVDKIPSYWSLDE